MAYAVNFRDVSAVGSRRRSAALAMLRVGRHDPCGMTRGAVRRSVVVSVVLGMMGLLLPSAGDAQPRIAAGDCGFSYVDVTVHNQTQLGMHPYFFDYGPTNSVCGDQHPGSIQAGKTGQWKVGDFLFGTSAEIRYRFPNGDEVQLTVFVYPGERNPSLGCGWTQLISSPRAFDCKANWVSGAVTGKANVELRVFPVSLPPASASVHAMQARPTVARRCPHASALIGTTTNKTRLPLRLVSVSHGPADAWCRAPHRSQTGHSATRWKLAGPRSGSSARFTYRLPNGDELDFAAAVNPRGGAIGCAPLDRARVRLFGCRAVRNRAGNSESPGIDLEIFRVRRP
jgi:hypothetical protein